MRLHFTIAIIVATSILTACADPNVTNVEVTPKLYWHVRHYGGGPVREGFDESTNYWVTNYYKPFVVSQGSPFTMDFAIHDVFTSPDTQKNEKYSNGVLAKLTVAVADTTVYFSGRADYNLHLGIHSGYTTGVKSLYGETLKSYSTRFRGTCDLGREMQIGTGEDIYNEPIVCLTFRQTSVPLCEFYPISLNNHDETINPSQGDDVDDLGHLNVIGTDFDSKVLVQRLELFVAFRSTYPTNHFYVKAIQLEGTNLVRAMIYWKELQIVWWDITLAGKESDDDDIGLWRVNSLQLDHNTADTVNDINGNYVGTHREWVDAMEQCIYEGKPYNITLNEATNAFPHLEKLKAAWKD